MSATDLSWLGGTVVVWAHPDDETYLSGGTVAALVDLGLRVVSVTATRGEAGGPDPSPAGRTATARLRTAELEDALQVLGVTEHHWLGYEDGRCADADPEPAVRCLADLLDDVRPDTVLTFGPDGFTGHPDHQAVSRWVDLALGRTAARPRLLHAVATEQDRVDPQLDEDFGVYELGQPRLVEPDELALRLDLDPASLRRKVTALELQASQTAGLIEAVGLPRFSAWVAVEAFADPATVAAR
ncbi:PIG-L family deacetylase [Nocardioides sp.]|uniref:PIG-L deacetylase family protein n=1 Tax=Nocardioides sp. TaxID=35761 RepID=UPI001A2E97FC|nr:PIG-L family deacetylase [Nocardioides sp.]MBJ7358851.1 PIG-L family deacetylase [Nocardioides sp.]